MKIVKAEIDWMHEWANNPKLYITADEDPNFADAIYDRLPHGIVACVKEPLISFYAPQPFSSNPRRHRGFGGRTFTFRMREGEPIVSNDVWSSRASYVSIPCVEVVVNNIATAMLLEPFMHTVRELGGFVVPQFNGDPYPSYVISSEADVIAKPQKPA